jgi:hypothetical protein
MALKTSTSVDKVARAAFLTLLVNFPFFHANGRKRSLVIASCRSTIDCLVRPQSLCETEYKLSGLGLLFNCVDLVVSLAYAATYLRDSSRSAMKHIGIACICVDLEFAAG